MPVIDNSVVTFLCFGFFRSEKARKNTKNRFFSVFDGFKSISVFWFLQNGFYWNVFFHFFSVFFGRKWKKVKKVEKLSKKGKNGWKTGFFGFFGFFRGR
jgi:hypothetical protein